MSRALSVQSSWNEADFYLVDPRQMTDTEALRALPTFHFLAEWAGQGPGSAGPQSPLTFLLGFHNRILSLKRSREVSLSFRSEDSMPEGEHHIL